MTKFLQLNEPALKGLFHEITKRSYDCVGDHCLVEDAKKYILDNL